MKRLSIVVPVYQNEANLPETVPRLLGLTERLADYEIEIVLVDDGSTDRSLEIASEFRAHHPGNILVVKLSRNFGQTPAVQAGLRFASGDCIAIISADLQEPFETIVDMVSAWQRGAKFVIGERVGREDSMLDRPFSGIYWWLVRRYAFQDHPRLGYDFCLVDRQLVDHINRISEKNTNIFLLIFWLGFRPTSIPIRRGARKKGRSQWRFSTKLRFTIDGILGFTTLPARILTFSGLVVAVLALIYLSVMLVQWVALRAAPPGWMSVVGLLTLFGAMGLFGLGIVAEYLLRILEDVRRRPPFVVDWVSGGVGASGKTDLDATSVDK